VNSEILLNEKIISSNLFNKAKANLIVFVDSIGSDDLNMKLKLTENGNRIKLNRVAYPQDTIATLSTFMTGVTPSVHGIVGSLWENEDGSFEAFSGTAGAKILNINDQMTQTFEGEPLIISASGNYQMTSAMGVNSRNVFGNNFNLYWSDKRANFDNVNYRANNFGLNVSKEQILNTFQGAFETKEEFFFVAELAFLKNMVNQLENEHFISFVNDKIPDLFSFSFASLKNLKATSDARKFEAAVQLLDQTLIEVVNKLSTLYSGKATVEIVFLGNSASEKLAKNTQLKNQVLSVLGQDVDQESFNAHFPSIYLKDSTQQQAVCSRVRQEIEHEVFCPDSAFAFTPISPFVSALEQNGTTPTTSYKATTFQTVLWMSIIMILFVLGAVYSIAAVSLEVYIDPWLQVRDTKEHQS